MLCNRTLEYVVVEAGALKKPAEMPKSYAQ